MSQVNIYLAGPIAGNTKDEANNWRNDFGVRLGMVGINAISPLRCEPLIGERYGMGYDDPRFGTPRAIASKNLMDVQRCDLTLCYFPKELTEAYGPSLGTVIELAWAKALGKPTIMVTDHPKIAAHPVVLSCCGWTLENMDQAYEVIVGVFADYANPWKRVGK